MYGCCETAWVTIIRLGFIKHFLYFCWADFVIALLEFFFAQWCYIFKFSMYKCGFRINKYIFYPKLINLFLFLLGCPCPCCLFHLLLFGHIQNIFKNIFLHSIMHIYQSILPHFFNSILFFIFFLICSLIKDKICNLIRSKNVSQLISYSVRPF